MHLAILASSTTCRSTAKLLHDGLVQSPHLRPRLEFLPINPSLRISNPTPRTSKDRAPVGQLATRFADLLSCRRTVYLSPSSRVDVRVCAFSRVDDGLYRACAVYSTHALVQSPGAAALSLC
eukprot:6195405-Pleurochrysis_carterae.AAC.1